MERPIRHLCWPWGYTEPGYSAAAEAAGFAVEYLTVKGINVAGTNPRQVSRIVVKNKAGFWFASRLFIWRTPWLGRIYGRLRGE